MKIKFKQALMSVAGFKELQELKFPPSITLQVYKLGKELDRELETYRELSKSIYKNHNVPEGDGGFDLSKVDSDTFFKISQDLDELLDQEVELKDYDIPFSMIEKYNNTCSTNMLIALDWLLNPEGLKKEKAPEEKALPAQVE